MEMTSYEEKGYKSTVRLQAPKSRKFGSLPYKIWRFLGINIKYSKLMAKHAKKDL